MKKRVIKIFIASICIVLIFTAGLIFYINQDSSFVMPVVGAHKKDYDQHSFGQPRVGHSHKGVDIFAKKGTPIISATNGIVVFTGVLSLGGNVVLILGPQFRFYYYAHLDKIQINKFTIVKKGDTIGTVGNTGNARTTPPHLHFSMKNIFPRETGFYIDPIPQLNETFTK